MAKGDAKPDLQSLMEVLKSLGIVAGGLGSLALLFFWIGNAVIVARLRAYNLYGIVHYTDEYVTEAGYQFFHDIFTFFDDWRPLLLFAAVIALLFLSLPVGPFAAMREGERMKSQSMGRVLSCFLRLRCYGIHYGLFLLMALAGSIILTTALYEQNLRNNIKDRKIRLSGIYAKMTDADRGPERQMVFVSRDIEESGVILELFADDLLLARPDARWLNSALEMLLGKKISDASLRQETVRFQKVAGIDEPPDFRFDGDFERSETYRTLRNIRLSERVRVELVRRIYHTLESLRVAAGDLYSQSLSSISGYYTVINRSLDDLHATYETVDAYFEPGNEYTQEVMRDLADIRPSDFGNYVLSYAFWILIGIFIYLLLNSPRLLRFGHWETGYYIAMVLLFLSLLISLPSAYGRYNFEFKVQRLENLVFSGTTTGEKTAAKQIKELLDAGASLYVLGPTKGKEVIVGAISPTPRGRRPGMDAGYEDRARLITLERSPIVYMSLDMTPPEDIPKIIQLLEGRGDRSGGERR